MNHYFHQLSTTLSTTLNRKTIWKSLTINHHYITNINHDSSKNVISINGQNHLGGGRLPGREALGIAGLDVASEMGWYHENTMAISIKSWNGYFYDIPWYFYLLANEIEIPSGYLT